MKKPITVLIRASGVGLAVGLLISFLFVSGVFETLELKTLDFRFKTYAERLTPDRDIVIVTIDQNSIDYLKHKMDIVWKWPRDVYAFVIRYLTEAGARAILLDFDFSDPDIDRAEFEKGETDRSLGIAIEEAGIVINSAYFSQGNGEDTYGEDIDYDSVKRFALDLTGEENLDIKEKQSVQPPINPIMQPSRGLGASNIYHDRDGIIRKIRMFHKFRGHIFASSPLALVLSVLNQSSVNVHEEYSMKLGEQKIQLNRKGDMYINWYGPGGPESNTFQYYPIADVLVSSLQQEDGYEPIIPPEDFENKIVLIGSNAPALFDLKPTPFSSDEVAYPGVEILATVINNLLDGNSLSRAGKGYIIVLIVIMCILTSFGATYLKSVVRSVSLTVVFMAGIYYTAIIAFRNNVFITFVPVEAGILFSFVVVIAINYFTEGKEKRWLKKAFSQYLSPSVIQEITEHPDKLKLGGEKRELTILFSDIRGFTSLSEKLEPEQVSNILNEYFTPMTEILFRHNGTLDKYIGDAIMAFFGAPLHFENHQSYACSAALEMIRELDKLKQKWISGSMPEYIQQMNIGIGINSGLVSVGNMGSTSRFDYTVIGDNVNLSSRLEGINKLYGSNIIVSENTYGHSKNEFFFRELDYIKVAGKTIPIRIYELIKAKEGREKEDRLSAEINRFHEGLERYRNRAWDDARRIFSELHEKEQTVKVYKLFMERCDQLKEKPIPEDWDGVYERRVK